MEPLWNIKQVAEYFQIRRETVYRWVKVGRLPKPENAHGDPRWNRSKCIECWKNWLPAKKDVTNRDPVLHA